MKIAFVGNFQPTHSTENDVRWTLEDMGHEVKALQEDIVTTDDMWPIAKNCDALLYVHTHGWLTPGSFPMRELLRRLKKASIPTISFHLDYWHGLDRASDVGTTDFWQSEWVFTADGDPRTQQWMQSLGINHHWSAPAVVKRDCYLAEPRKIKHDVIFVGNRHYHHEWPYREQLIHWLEVQYRDRFTHYGGDGKRTVRGAELNQLYADTKVVVGDSICLGFDHQNYWSDRVYETRGRGGFLIMPDIQGLDDHLIKYKFGDFDELRNKIDFWVYQNDEREMKRIEYQDYVRQNHTYTNRFETIFKTIGLTK